MNDSYYVATDTSGVDRHADEEIDWNLPNFNGGSWQEADVTERSTPDLVLWRSGSLLDVLDERIYRARPVSEAVPVATGDAVSTSRAILVSETGWNPTTAAEFALSCAEHVSADYEAVQLPDGSTIGDVMADARQVISQSAEDAEHRMGRLAQLAAARRLKRRGEEISDLALEILNEVDQGHLDALDDVRYATTASIVDAVLCVVETVRHIALPRYIGARESVADTHGDGAPSSSTIISTPWGPIALGTEHQQPYAPSWVAARDAARRARDAAASETDSSADQERTWQAGRLEEFLGS